MNQPLERLVESMAVQQDTYRECPDEKEKNLIA
jgi:hypothetical protein